MGVTLQHTRAAQGLQGLEETRTCPPLGPSEPGPHCRPSLQNRVAFLVF